MVPMAVKYQDILKNIASEANIARFMEATNLRIEAMKLETSAGDKTEFHIFVDSSGEADDVVRVFRRLGGDDAYFVRSRKRSSRNVDKELSEVFYRYKIGDNDRVELFAVEGRLKIVVSKRNTAKPLKLNLVSERAVMDALLGSFAQDFVGARMKTAAAYAAKELSAATKSTMTMKSIFGE